MASKTDIPPRFVHLHLHSQYSLLDGGNRLDRLIDHVKDLGMDAVAVTDHGNLFGAMDFYNRAKTAGIKPILGIEAYVAADIDGRPSDRTLREYTGVSDGGFHLVLLAMNSTGWSNMIKLSSDAFVNGYYYKPRMDKSTLVKWHEGLIAINGHLGSSIAHHMIKLVQTGDEKHYEAARQEAIWHRETFGPDSDGQPRFYLELQRHEEQLQTQINPHIQKLAAELDIPLVCDNDAHFMLAEDHDVHDTMCCISMSKVKGDEDRLHYPESLYVKSPAEMAELFHDVPEAIANTAAIADRCNVELPKGANHAPVVNPVIDAKLAKLKGTPDQVVRKFKSEHRIGSSEWLADFCQHITIEPVREDAAGDGDTKDGEKGDLPSRDELEQRCDQALRLLAEAGLVWRYGTDGVTDEIRARLERELGILADKHISAYFIIVWDFVNYARSNGIPVNARGSGVGTMTGYVLGLSNACPVKYGLLFERFTDPDRSEYPDIDIDMCQDGRQDVLRWVRDKYGYVAQIITYNVLKAKAAIRDVGRVLELPLPDVDKLCKLIGDGLGETLDSAMEREADLRKLYDGNPLVRNVYNTARKLEGMARHHGVHAAGVIVATQPLDNIVPLAISRKNDDDLVITQWDGPTCEKVGLLKMDFLGLRTLSIINRAVELVKNTLPEKTIRQTVDPQGEMPDEWDPMDLERLTYDDPKVLSLFARGETAGVFQFESGGMRNLLMAMKPDRLEDLIAANALYRPGPMELIPNYNNRKHGREEVPKVHPIVDSLTADTHGIMVYQEQVMQVVNQLGGIPLRQAYTLIKAISKKKESVINENRAQFIIGATDKGLSEDQAGELFELILKFAGYGFNKSHSTGYSIIAYQTAYLKTYFPVQYMAALMTYESVSTDKVVEYMQECQRVLRPSTHSGGEGKRGIEVKPPDVNTCFTDFSVVYEKGEPRDSDHGHIRFGLSAVKGVGDKAVEAIIEQRKKDGPFTSLHDFCERVDLRSVNRATIEALIKCGAFDTIHGIEKRAALCDALESAMRTGQRAAADRDSGQLSMFGGAMGGNDAANEAADQPADVALPNIEPWTTKQQLEHEKQVLGLYVSSHPLDQHRDAVRRFASCTIAEALELPADVPVTLGGMLTRVRPTVTRAKQEKMAMLTLDDLTGQIDAVTFPRTYAVAAPLLDTDRIVFLQGKVDRRREEPNIIVDQVIAAEVAATKLTRQVRIVITDLGTPDKPGRLNGELRRLRDLLRQSASLGDDARAQVLVELHQHDHVACFRIEGLRVAADNDLPGRIASLLSHDEQIQAQCELQGPDKPLAPNGNGQSSRQAAPLAMTSRQQGGEHCASIDRY